MLRVFEFKLEPTRSQSRRLNETLESCRHVYNWAVEDRTNLWQYARCPTNFYDQSRYLVNLKKERPELQDCHVYLLQTAIKRVDLAFQAFFRRVRAGERPGYPKFRGRNRYGSFSFKEEGNGFGLDGKRLRLSKIGRVRIRLHRKLEGEIRTCTVKKREDGWFALFVVETENPKPKELVNPIGVDLGVSKFAVLSNGEVVKNPRFIKKAEAGLRRA